MILDNKSIEVLQDIINSVKNVPGMTAEIGVYKGDTTKIIHSILNRTHYCYDTFQGIVNAGDYDKHKNGEFYCDLDTVIKNVNMENVVYKVGLFPDTFCETADFCFVYSDTATYYGAKNTLLYFLPIMSRGGKIVFYSDSEGVERAISEWSAAPTAVISRVDNFVILSIDKL